MGSGILKFPVTVDGGEELWERERRTEDSQQRARPRITRFAAAPTPRERDKANVR